MQIMACEEVSYRAMGSEPDSMGAEYRKLIQESFDEIKQGVSFIYSPEVAIGRKPLQSVA